MISYLMKTSTNLELLPKGPLTIIKRYIGYIDKLKKKPIIIAIDGHSSCGKSTLSKDLAYTLGYRHIDTGAMYRAVTLFFLNYSINMDDSIEVEKAISKIDISFTVQTDGTTHTHLNGEDIESDIRTLEVSHLVSEVATLPPVRKFLVAQQQLMGRGKAIVMDGRDIATVVFPDAEVKLFMTADPKVRAQRRHEELKLRGEERDFDDIYQNLLKRDHIDSTREDSPLRKSDSAVTIDSTNLDRQQQLLLALEIAASKID